MNGPLLRMPATFTQILKLIESLGLTDLIVTLEGERNVNFAYLGLGGRNCTYLAICL